MYAGQKIFTANSIYLCEKKEICSFILRRLLNKKERVINFAGLYTDAAFESNDFINDELNTAGLKTDKSEKAVLEMIRKAENKKL